MPKPMREVTRRNLINHARDAGEKRIAAVVASLLRRRFTVLRRELRNANLRKRLNKAIWGSNRQRGIVPDDQIERAKIAIDAVLFKNDGESWNDWIDSFADSLRESLVPVVEDVYGAETKYWESRNARPAQVDPQRIISDYERRTGKQIKNIGADTQNAVIDIIQRWYNTDAGLPELIDSLEYWFSESRAETIARTESTYITSGVSDNLYNQFHVRYFNVDLADEDGDWPCDECREKAANNPHPVGSLMPPFHPRDRCGTVPADEDGNEFIFG